MVSRRDFLVGSSATGLLLSTGMAACAPTHSLSEQDKHNGVKTGDPIGSGFSGGQLEYLNKKRQTLLKDPKEFLGYPGNMNIPPEGYFKWRDEVFSQEVGQRTNNNVGDPYRSRSVYNAHFLEAQTIDRFAARLGFSQSNAWGFISNSGTDSNMHGIYMGRTLLQQKTGTTPKIYYTKEAHYSIEIIRDLLAIEEVLIDTLDDGAMDTNDLAQKLADHKEAPALVLATVGTTFKGAIDHIDLIQAALRGYDAYVHLDAALFGGYLQASQFVEDLNVTGLQGKRYDSISISCHKFFGFPMVAGLFITSKKSFEEYRDYFSKVHNPAYISHVPGTITCSRDTLAPTLFHYFSTDESFKIQQQDAKQMLSNANYLHNEMTNHFPDLEAKLANDRSNTVHFKQVKESLKKKWSLATIETGDGELLTHVVVMPHASRSYLDRFLADLEASNRG